ncbi:MAG TPA: DUF1844 domain-containing protein [Bacteroidota bacterium]|nr:DUF1844 domain-containing protein [Bacteroidota bacterium]
MSTNEKDELLLTQLILMFQTAAFQQMGKIKNPLLEKMERDLQQAQISIDMIDMMHRKMQGNLSPEEEKLLKNVLQELRLNYVDEVSKTPQPVDSSTQPTPPK